MTIPSGGGLTLPYTATQASTTPLFSITNSSTTGDANALYGATASTGAGSVTTGASGIVGEATSTSGGAFSAAIRGINRSTSGLGVGVVGYQAGSGYGIYGEAPDGSGIVGNSNTGRGLYGNSNSGYGAYLTSNTGTGLYATSGSTAGGSSATSGATAVFGELTATSGGGFSAAVRGVNRSTSGLGIGVIGYHAGGGYGVYGEAPSGYGIFAKSTSGYGIYSSSSSSYGAYITSSSGTGAYITSSSGLALIAGSGDVLVYNTLTAGRTTVGNGNNGVNAYSTAGIGVYASSTASAGGAVDGEGAYIGVQGVSTGTNTNRQAIRGDNAGSTSGYAGVFVGTVGVFGTLTKTAGSFQIDDPIDPANKFLVHSFVESPDMKNIYDGIVTTDANGDAVVIMPDWFQPLNIDYRYQLTCINQFAQAIVSKEMAGNQFTIKTDKPNVKVSWQVTGTRNDPYARDNRLPVEKLKRPDEQGKYIYPQGYGRGRESALDVIRTGATVPEKTTPDPNRAAPNQPAPNQNH